MTASARIGKCRTCGRLRPLRELLEVRDRLTDELRFVCRPTLDDQRDHGCFRRSVGRADREEIRLASPEGGRP